jgi:hypothetical protein
MTPLSSLVQCVNFKDDPVSIYAVEKMYVILPVPHESFLEDSETLG